MLLRHSEFARGATLSLFSVVWALEGEGRIFCGLGPSSAASIADDIFSRAAASMDKLIKLENWTTHRSNSILTYGRKVVKFFFSSPDNRCLKCKVMFTMQRLRFTFTLFCNIWNAFFVRPFALLLVPWQGSITISKVFHLISSCWIRLYLIKGTGTKMKNSFFCVLNIFNDVGRKFHSTDAAIL